MMTLTDEQIANATKDIKDCVPQVVGLPQDTSQPAFLEISAPL